MSGGFWYLGSPYSKYPLGLNAAHKAVCENAALLLRAGVHVFSPIAHSHPIAVHGNIDPYDHDIWLSADRPIMEAAKGIIVLRLPSWKRSYGLYKEVEWFTDAGKRVVYMNPGRVPKGVTE